MKKLLLIIFLLPSTNLTKAQTECAAATFFENNTRCPAVNRGSKCIELDIRHSVDKDGKELIYSWNFGDGTIKQGYLSDYCFQHYGTFTISLDLLDPKTSVVVRNELTKQVTLLPPLTYHTDTVAVNRVNLHYDTTLLPGVQAREVYWRVEDEFKCGLLTPHSFKANGLHIIEVGVKGFWEGKQFSGCTLMGIYVKGDE